MPDFNPALPLPIKWTINDDRFDPEKQVLSLTIPVDSLTHLIDHLQNLVNTKAKEGEVYDFAKKEKVKTQCVQSSLKRWMAHTEYLATLIHRRLTQE